MIKGESFRTLNRLGNTRLSKNFFMRDFLYSEIASYHNLSNMPDHPEVAIRTGSELCNQLLEPLKEKFGHISIRSAYRSPLVNDFGNKNKLNCARNEWNFGRHIWDYPDSNGNLGATTCITIPWFHDQVLKGKDWQSLAWWIHDHLPYSSLYFFNNLTAFNIRWCEVAERRIDSYKKPRGLLTKEGFENWDADHSSQYQWLL